MICSCMVVMRRPTSLLQFVQSQRVANPEQIDICYLFYIFYLQIIYYNGHSYSTKSNNNHRYQNYMYFRLNWHILLQIRILKNQVINQQSKNKEKYLYFGRKQRIKMKNQQQNKNAGKNLQSLTNQLQWIAQKKLSHLQQLSKFQMKNQDIVNNIITALSDICKSKVQLQAQLAQFKKQNLKKQEQNAKNIDQLRKQIQRYMTQTSQYRHDISNKDELYNKTTQDLIKKQKQTVQQELKILQLQSQIQNLIKQHQIKITELTQINNKNIQDMIKKYQKFIQQKIALVQQKSQEELDIIKNNNKNLIQQLEEKSKNNINSAQEQIKKNNTDYQRIVTENGRLLANVNQFKRKIVNLQTQLEATQQQARIGIKQNQIINANFKRQIQYLKDNKISLEQRIKSLIQTNDQNKWEVKQIMLEKDKQIKKIKEESQSMIDQIVSSYKSQISDFKIKIKQIKNQNEQLIRKHQQVRKQRDSAKQVIQFLKKQKQRLNIQKQSQQAKKNSNQLSQQTQTYKLKSLASELKKQILRKNAQIEVLKQQISRLKTKVNKVTVAYQQNIKAQELMEKQNKMLLSQIVFLRDKNKSKLLSTNKKVEKQNNRSRNSSRILDMKSEQSAILDNDNGAELQMYKQLIVEMEKDMNEAVAKLDQKNNIIQKQKAIIQRLERALNK